MRRRIGESLLELKLGDLTCECVDAIVNAANSRLMAGGGIDGALHRAGGPAIQAELAQRYPDGCPPGSAVATGAGRLPARLILHAVGPVWKGGRHGESELLRSACEACLQLAVDHSCSSIAFPAISTGIYSYPMDQAAQVICCTMIDFLREADSPLNVRIVLLGEGAYGAFSRVLEHLLPE